jgi:hypothetical protein
MSRSASLTGVWDGQYCYPRLLPPNAFTAVIFETGGAISGAVHEVAATGKTKGQTVTAAIDGTHAGGAVSFTKTYDLEGQRRARPVLYDGQVNAEATHIAGRWTIPGVWSGTFVMTRSPRAEETAAIERQVLEPVDG